MLPLSGRSETIFIVTTIFLCISFIAVCLRCFVRIKIVRAFGWDDALMVFAMVPARSHSQETCFLLTTLPVVKYSVRPVRDHGLSLWNWSEVHSRTGKRDNGDGDVCKFSTMARSDLHDPLRAIFRLKSTRNKKTNDIQLTSLQWWWLGQTSYVWVCAIAKISIAVALLRLTVAKTHAIILWIVIGMTAIVGLVFWFILTLQCTPVSYFWRRVPLFLDPTLPIHGSCMSVDSIIDMAYVYSVTATLCDLTLGLLPIALVWNLQMNRRTKVALAGILGMGCVYVATYIDT